MTKKTFNVCLTNDEGLDLEPLVGRLLTSWDAFSQDIIEDSVLFNHTKTLKTLTALGMTAIQASSALIEIQNKFIQFDEHSNEQIEGDGVEFSKLAIFTVHTMLQQSRFFIDELTEDENYTLAKITLEKEFGVTIPCL